MFCAALAERVLASPPGRTIEGAGTLGFAGTTRKDNAFRAAGLTELTDGEFGGGPTVPMMPGTWDDADHDPARRTEPREGG
ncbi:hypothetical protein A5674_05055 [Mycobacterium malmoense]|nr:hypothetical protein A5674_05055 [Mycobacterium malmoense]